MLSTRPLGKNGPLVTRVGLGLMGISTLYGLPAPDEERLAFLDKAHEMGEIFWDSADMYGDSEDLLGKWFARNPEKRKDIFLATKFGNRLDVRGKIDSTPEYCLQAIESSLRRLGLPYVDLYYVHRIDQVTPIEKTMRALVQLKEAGKIKHIGLSECSAATLRRAHAVHPIACIQMEYSPVCLEIESPQFNLLQTARELGVAIVAYSPLGKGLLSGAIRSREDFEKPGDFRGIMPWLSADNFDNNLSVADSIATIANAKAVTPGQLILAWVLHQGDDFFPIPGTTKVDRLRENLKSLDISITRGEDKAIRAAGEKMKGARLPESYLGGTFADTPLLEE
ncbi:Aldo/keto reductase [Thozetella sp. PMI_491]|nr:Aldo/keto reductase [Thozetella sp. PMI_491]